MKKIIISIFFVLMLLLPSTIAKPYTSNNNKIIEDLPDLIVKDIIMEDGYHPLEWIFWAKIKNIGVSPANRWIETQIIVKKWWYGYNSTIIVINESFNHKLENELEPGETVDLLLCWSSELPTPGFFIFDCTVNPSYTIEETTYSNNKRSEKFYGTQLSWRAGWPRSIENIEIIGNSQMSKSEKQSRTSVESKSVETAVRIHRSTGITPYTLKFTEKESNEVDRIFDDLKASLDSAVTDDEIDEIYDNSIESLYELGIFPRMTIDEAKQLIEGKSKSQSGNIGNADENFDCRVIGWTTKTFMFDLARPLMDFLLEFGRIGMCWYEKNLMYYKGKMGYISFSNNWWDFWEDYYHHSHGWVWTNGTNGVVKWEGKLYGNITSRIIWGGGGFDRLNVELYMGVKDFTGIFFDSPFEDHVYFVGNAAHVKISYSLP